MLRRCSPALNFTTRIRKEREAARPLLIKIYKKPYKPPRFENWDAMPSCALCGEKFPVKEEWAAHKESVQHKDRERWQAQEQMYASSAHPALRRREEEDWNWYVDTILKPKAEATGTPLEDLKRQSRKARMPQSKEHHDFLDYPEIKAKQYEPTLFPTAMGWCGDPEPGSRYRLK